MRNAGTRLGRKVAEAVTSYRELDPDLRARFESGLLAARDALQSADEIPAKARRALLEAIAMAFVEGLVGGAWGKVHLALAETAPALYDAVKELLPDASGTQGLAL